MTLGCYMTGHKDHSNQHYINFNATLDEMFSVLKCLWRTIESELQELICTCKWCSYPKDLLMSTEVFTPLTTDLDWGFQLE